MSLTMQARRPGTKSRLHKVQIIVQYKAAFILIYTWHPFQALTIWWVTEIKRAWI